ncbi:hypothetical protein Y032_0006g3151 [Ancylostoma ceylanicum]|nr:hypothetical protein Y032_0006g3151 [Ancylostoma ceylanicum]
MDFTLSTLRDKIPERVTERNEDTKTIALVASIVSYVLYNVLFLAAQLWPAFATLFLGLYYLSICYGYAKKNRTVMIVGTVLQALVALIISGLFIFFVVEIFTPHVVYKILVYIKNMAESQGLAAARNCSIAMAIDSLITAAIHFWTLYFCIQECRVESNEKQEKPEKPEKQEKPTETYRFAEQSWTMLTNALNRLRFQRECRWKFADLVSTPRDRAAYAGNAEPGANYGVFLIVFQPI